ncbi:4'-phosphopantetheinyl transferase family protein [Actinokineospora iranica]|uniref:4'-phosphopantetheinyl transferase family protein n=1 Tax=Actinokineospora iranica TaxID=1271860 RepID=UPI0015874984|nr:4'-phosphopantetheinyl transferase superfamily protein [Actinokineospora iranica]
MEPWSRTPSDARDLLGDDLARYQRSTRVAFRRRLVASRAMAQAVAEAALGRPVRLAKDPRGRPSLTGESAVDVSLAHTGDVLVTALSRAGRVGVDVEVRDRPLRTPAFVARACHPSETDLSTEDMVWLWTAKEALAKASGEGLALDFRIIQAAHPPAGWRVRSAIVADRYRITTAVESAVEGKAKW